MFSELSAISSETLPNTNSKIACYKKRIEKNSDSKMSLETNKYMVA